MLVFNENLQRNLMTHENVMLQRQRRDSSQNDGFYNPFVACIRMKKTLPAADKNTVHF